MTVPTFWCKIPLKLRKQMLSISEAAEAELYLPTHKVESSRHPTSPRNALRPRPRPRPPAHDLPYLSCHFARKRSALIFIAITDTSSWSQHILAHSLLCTTCIHRIHTYKTSNFVTTVKSHPFYIQILKNSTSNKTNDNNLAKMNVVMMQWMDGGQQQAPIMQVICRVCTYALC